MQLGVNVPGSYLHGLVLCTHSGVSWYWYWTGLWLLNQNRYGKV